MVGRTLSHCRILEKIGEGGMGVVYKARDTHLDRFVAIKVLPPERVADPDRKRRFMHEARSASALNHPNIVHIYDIDESDGVDFISMEYVEGKPLNQLIASGPMSIRETLRYAVQITDALTKAHSAGIIHRDLKPSNIMVTNEGTVKLLDFGLAKLTSSSEATTGPMTAETLTSKGAIVGTVAYMSPEQAEGKPLDFRSDVFSAGVAIYEMLTGRRPFLADSQLGTLMAIVRDPPRRIEETRSDVPPELVRVVNRCLEKEPARRYASAAEAHKELVQLELALTSGRVTLPQLLRRARRPSILVPVTALVLGLALLAAWAVWRATRVRWAGGDGLALCAQLVQQGAYTAAFDLAKELEALIPNDPRLKALWPDVARTVWIETDPAGADIHRRDYDEPETAWRRVGMSPAQLTVPRGYFRWKFVKEGFEDSLQLAPASMERQKYRLSPKMQAPENMVHVSEAPATLSFPIARLGNLNLLALPAFWIDRGEVTNRQFKDFVERGGYSNRAYWKHPFRKQAGTASWDEAMREFTDTTGRPGPATWEAGTYPAGADDYPVRGVSWFEAAAYAEFAGKQLPTIYHWYRAADVRTATWVVPRSNFRPSGPSPAGRFPATSPCGAYDMAGNVREWCFNETDGGLRFTLGGAWSDPTYTFTMPDARSPFNRDPQNGFRCVRYVADPPAAMLNPKLQTEFPKPEPVSDTVFRSYEALFAYEHRERSSRTVEVDRSNPDWIRERVTFEAAYGREQVPGILFLPKNAKPPYQAVVYHPSAAAQQMTDSRSLDGTPRWDYLIRGGRAVFHPVLPGTYERKRPPPATPVASLARLVERVQDVRRAVDYLESRPEIDRERIAYLGGSWGAGSGPIVLGVEPRFKAAVLQDGGFFVTPPVAELNGVNYAPRARMPVLMINGRYDYFFPLEASQKPMFNLLGAGPDRKKHVILEASHDVSILRQKVMRETLDWLDKYLGPVNR